MSQPSLTRAHSPKSVICWMALSMLATSAVHAATLVGVKGVADAKADVTLSSLLSTQTPAAISLSLSPQRRHVAVKNALAQFSNPGTNALVAPRTAALPVSGFSAVTDNHTFTPPDTNGSVGPAHVMTLLNTLINVQDKTGSSFGTTAIQNFWEGVNPGGSAFDPRLVFDALSGRWIALTLANPASATSGVMVGVSKTSDPTGAWSIYKINADPAGKLWLDFPSLGVNKDWIVLTASKTPVKGGSFVNMSYYVFDKADLMNGGSGNYTLFSEAYISGQTTERLATASVVTDPQLAKLFVVESTFPNDGTLRVSEIAGAVGSETFTTGTASPKSPLTWSAVTPQTDLGPQAGSAIGIDTNDSIVMNSVYRNGSIWCSQLIYFTNPNRASIQWWQFTPDGTLQQSGVIDDPTGATMYAFPSIAVNKNNDALVAYTRFKTGDFASSYGSVRLGTDAPNTLQPEMRLKSGEAPYVVNGGPNDNRWGDYSATCVDPSNDTDLWTIQEYAHARVSNSDRSGTWWSRISPVASATSGLSITPNPASVGRTVRFALGAPPGSVVTWNFGDGSTTIGASVSHIFAAEGSYSISATVTDSASFSIAAPLQVFIDTDGDGVPDLAETDSDNDGFTNAIEALAGTSPTNVNSTPVGNQAAVIAPLILTKVAFKFDLKGGGTSNVQLTGTLPVPTGFVPAGQTLYVDCIGIAAKFTLDAKGKDTQSNLQYFQLSPARNGIAKFKAALAIDIVTQEPLLRHTGLDLFDKDKGDPRQIALNILFNSIVYQATHKVLLTVTPGKSGTAITGK